MMMMMIISFVFISVNRIDFYPVLPILIFVACDSKIEAGWAVGVKHKQRPATVARIYGTTTKYIK